MEKVCLITDSASDLPKDLAQEYDIWVLPVTVTYGGKEAREYYDIEPKEFWDFLETHEELPSTAQISPAQYLEAFARAEAEGYDKVICLMINGDGSGTLASGKVAIDLYRTEHTGGLDIRLIDSKNYTIAYGQAMVLARQALREGVGFEEVVSLVEDHISRVEAVAAIFTLRQLKKSGRINGAAAFMGELLGIKPMIHLCDGQVNIPVKVRGDKALLPKMFDYVRERADRSADQRRACFVIHGDIPDREKEEVHAFLREEFGLENVRDIPFGCSLTTNTGPNVIGIVYYGEKRG